MASRESEIASVGTGGRRRSFLSRLGVMLLGGLAVLGPPSVGLLTFIFPWRRASVAEAKVRIGSINELVVDGPPRRVSVVSARRNAWMTEPNATLGAVYLRRIGPDRVEALSVVCPHAGCLIDYDQEEGNYLCPCHKSRFLVSGEIAERGSPSPRGMDSMEAEVRDDGAIWLRFMRYQTGRKDKRPIG